MSNLGFLSIVIFFLNTFPLSTSEQLYRDSVENREWSKEALQNFYVEDKKCEENSTQLHTAFLNDCNIKNWSTEEAAVLRRAREENKPIVLAFVGVDFCPWSHKMTVEILEQESFIEEMGDEVILWQYPLHSEINPQEDRMRSKYKIEECPTIVVLDPQAREFARYGYLPLEPRVFAKHILKTIADFKEICIALNEHRGTNDVKMWSELYHKAKQFSSQEFKKIVLERGVQEDPGIDFLIEQYTFLLESSTYKNSAVKKCKEKLLRKDPENRFGIHFKIAMAEFHKNVSEKKSDKHPKKILRPLLRYLEHFENKDKDNVWNAEMVIAHYLHAIHAKQSALEFAKRALQRAPESQKQNIANFLTDIESH